MWAISQLVNAVAGIPYIETCDGRSSQSQQHSLAHAFAIHDVPGSLAFCLSIRTFTYHYASVPFSGYLEWTARYMKSMNGRLTPSCVKNFASGPLFNTSFLQLISQVDDVKGPRIVNVRCIYLHFPSLRVHTSMIHLHCFHFSASIVQKTTPTPSPTDSKLP